MLFLLFTLLVPQASQIHVKSLSYTDSDRVRLIDVIESSSLEEKQKKALSKIELSDHLNENAYRIFSKDFLIDILKNAKLDDSSKIKIPNKAYVANKKSRWTKENIEASLRKRLNNRCSDCQIQIDIKQVGAYQNTISWNFDLNQDYRNQRLYIPTDVQYLNNGKILNAKTNIVADIFFRKEVPVLNNNMNRGTRVSEEDIVMRKIILPHHGRFYTNKGDIIGRKTKKVLKEGQLVLFNDLEKSLAVRRGQEIRALISSDNIEISLNVIAKEDGSLGDTIKVRMPHAKKDIHAYVKNQSEVEIK